MGAYPTHGLHVQRTATRVAAVLCAPTGPATGTALGLSTSMVWYLHERHLVRHMLVDLSDLVKGPEQGDRAPSEETTTAPPLVRGSAAEAAGCWVLALEAIVNLLVASCKHDSVLIADLEAHGGYDLVSQMACESSEVGRCAAVLQLVARLVLVPEPGASNEDRVARLGAPAFQVMQKVLAQNTHVLGSISLGQGLSPADATAMLGRAVRAAAESALARGIARGIARGTEARREQSRGAEARRLLVLNTALEVFAANPKNYNALESRFHVFSLLIATLSAHESAELRALALSALEYVSLRALGGPAHRGPALGAASLTWLTLCQVTLENGAKGKDAAVLVQDIKVIASTLTKLMAFEPRITAALAGHLEGPMGDLLQRLIVGCPELTDSTSDSDPRRVALDVLELACSLLSHLLRNWEGFRTASLDIPLVSLTRCLKSRPHVVSVLACLEEATTRAAGQDLKNDIASLIETVHLIISSSLCRQPVARGAWCGWALLCGVCARVF